MDLWKASMRRQGIGARDEVVREKQDDVGSGEIQPPVDCLGPTGGSRLDQAQGEAPVDDGPVTGDEVTPVPPSDGIDDDDLKLISSNAYLPGKRIHHEPERMRVLERDDHR